MSVAMRLKCGVSVGLLIRLLFANLLTSAPMAEFEIWSVFNAVVTGTWWLSFWITL